MNVYNLKVRPLLFNKMLEGNRIFGKLKKSIMFNVGDIFLLQSDNGGLGLRVISTESNPQNPLIHEFQVVWRNN